MLRFKKTIIRADKLGIRILPKPTPIQKYRLSSRTESMLKYMLDLFSVDPRISDRGPGPIRNTIEYPKYLQIIVYNRYIRMIGYIFGTSYIFYSFGFSGIISGLSKILDFQKI